MLVTIDLYAKLSSHGCILLNVSSEKIQQLFLLHQFEFRYLVHSSTLSVNMTTTLFFGDFSTNSNKKLLKGQSSQKNVIPAAPLKWLLGIITYLHLSPVELQCPILNLTPKESTLLPQILVLLQLDFYQCVHILL